MGLKIIMTICLLPVLPIFYGAMRFCAGEKKGILYGVTLWEGARENQQVQEIQKAYRRGLNLWGLVCLLLFLLTLITEHESLMISGQVLWIFLVLVLLFLPFQRANRQMLCQKREFLSQHPKNGAADGKVWVDVTAAAARRPKFFRKSLYMGCAFAAMPAVAELFLYSIWHNPLMPDFWDCEIILLLLAAVVFLFPMYLSVMERQQTPVLSKDSQVNQQLARARSYQWGKLCMALAWATGGLNWGILLGFHLPAEWFLWVMVGTASLSAFASLGIIALCWRRLDRAGEAGESMSNGYGSSACAVFQENAGEMGQDGDEHWIWGMFYYNEKDARSMVEKRVGIGVTGNMAKPKVRYATFLTLAVLCLWMVGMCAWVVMEEFTPVSLSYENGTVVARHWREVLKIQASEIVSAELLWEKPEIRRRSGTAMQTVEKGDYYDQDRREDIRVCLDPRKMPCLKIGVGDGRVYLLGSSEEGEAEKAYQALQQELGAMRGRQKSSM
ncbi:MAG: hypothetical protein HFH39_10310 [Lachnospiraceae bacterium]|nr:hypothetical protein [Lachnospiraceae bacterium]